MFKIVKNILLISTAFLAIVSGNSHAMEQKKDVTFETFYKQNTKLFETQSVDAHIKTVLDQNLNNGDTSTRKLIQDGCRAGKSFGIYEYTWLPNYIVKYNDMYDTKRIEGALFLAEFIAQQKLDAVSIPSKKFYRDKSGRLYVIVQKIQRIKKSFSLKQIQQLYKIIKHCQYCDPTRGNIFNTEKDVAYIIDTETNSFADSDNFYNSEIFEGSLERLESLDIEPNARKWLNQRIQKKREKIYSP